MKRGDLEALRDVQTKAELLEAFMRIGNSLGFPLGTMSFRSGIYAKSPSFGSVALSPPDWLKRAGDRDLSMADPVFAKVNTSVEPFIYGPDFYASHGAGNLWDLGAKYGYRNGPVASLHLSAERALIWGFDTDELLPADESRRLQLLANTQLIGIYAHQAAERLLDYARPILTDRQREILRHVRSGRSSYVISALTGIKPDTVEYHMKKIREVLGVRTRLQAIDKAISLGLLSDEP